MAIEDKVVELLARVVDQNEQILSQNREFLAFVQKRDADLAERTRLEVAHLSTVVALEDEDKASIAHIYETLGVGRGDLLMVSILKEFGIYDAGKAIRERIKTAGRLPQGSDE